MGTPPFPPVCSNLCVLRTEALPILSGKKQAADGGADSNTSKELQKSFLIFNFAFELGEALYQKS
jgi:hypothetical protein